MSATTLTSTALTSTALTDWIDDTQIAELRHVGAARPAVVVIEARETLCELAVGELVSSLIPTRAARLTDVRILRPESGTWTVEEVDETVLPAAALAPALRNVIVLLNAQRMAPACADHLLKVIEEPLAPTTFVFGCPSVGDLPATIRGRVGRVVTLRAHPHVVREYLVGCGLDETLVTRAQAVLGDDLLEVTPYAPDVTLLSQLLDAAVTLVPARRAVPTAWHLGQLLEDMARPTASDATAQRRAQRELARLLITAWRTQVVRVLAQRPEFSERAAARLAGFDQASRVLDLYGPVNLALAQALTGTA